MKRRSILYFVGGLLSAIIIAAVVLYKVVFDSGIRINAEYSEIFIPTGSNYDQVMDSLDAKVVLSNPGLFNWIAEKKNYHNQIKPGKYTVYDGMSYLQVVNLLRSGKQTPVNVTFSIIRSLNDLAGRVGTQIEADSSDIILFLSEPANYREDGYTKENIISVFIPNTYEFFWNTSPEDFYRRMLREHKAFWNDERLTKTKEKGLTPVEVAVLASIIDDEVAKADEKPRIAGVYLNRLKRGMLLQACPTIRFALNDFTITRVLNKHLVIDSPYNTYKHRGLPPGPIGCPTIEGIDAVLNAEKHDFIFFAAKPDFSGYHNFSRTLSEHNRFASIYHQELNKRKIFK